MTILSPVPPSRLAPLGSEELVAHWTGSEPEVSILCPTFNHEEFVEDAICGFLGQETDFAFEVLIRDDGSTDRTAEIINDYAARYQGVIKPVLEKRNTFATTRPISALAAHARAPYLALCEGDDYWIDPRKLAKQKAFLDANQWCSIVHHDIVILDDDSDGYGLEIQGHLTNSDSWRKRERCPSLYFAAFGNYVMTCTMMLRATSIDWSRLSRAPRPGPGDIAIVALASEHSDIGFQDFTGSAYRVSSSGFWSSMDQADRRTLTSQMFQWLGEELPPGPRDLFLLRASADELANRQVQLLGDSKALTDRVAILEAEQIRTRHSVSTIITHIEQQQDSSQGQFEAEIAPLLQLKDLENRGRENLSTVMTELDAALFEANRQLAASEKAYQRLVGRRAVRAALRAASLARPLFRIVRRLRRFRIRRG